MIVCIRSQAYKHFQSYSSMFNFSIVLDGFIGNAFCEIPPRLERERSIPYKGVETSP